MPGKKPREDDEAGSLTMETMKIEANGIVLSYLTGS